MPATHTESGGSRGETLPPLSPRPVLTPIGQTQQEASQPRDGGVDQPGRRVEIRFGECKEK